MFISDKSEHNSHLLLIYTCWPYSLTIYQSRRSWTLFHGKVCLVPRQSPWPQWGSVASTTGSPGPCQSQRSTRWRDLCHQPPESAAPMSQSPAAPDSESLSDALSHPDRRCWSHNKSFPQSRTGDILAHGTEHPAIPRHKQQLRILLLLSKYLNISTQLYSLNVTWCNEKDQSDNKRKRFHFSTFTAPNLKLG